MNNELKTVIEQASEELSMLETNQSTEYLAAKAKVIKLQKQLLSASVLKKVRLEEQIKAELKQAELKLFELSNDNRQLELAYLEQYIKENYE